MSKPKFIQIANEIEQRILDGQYPSNFKLPPHRVLAAEFNTTPVTISKAYHRLAENNLVESFVGRGTFVCGNTELNDVIQPVDDGQADYNFSILQPCLEQNISILKQASLEASSRLDLSLMGYAENSGAIHHRDVGVKWAQHYGLEHGNTNNTLLTNGAQHALSILVHSLTKEGDVVAVEGLTYPGILSILSLSGRRVVGVEMDEFGMRPDHLSKVILENKPKMIITLPSHQNPTGITMPEVRRKEIAKIVAKTSIWLVEDDIYGFLNPTPIPAITNMIPDQAFHITSLSKAISPALRCGYMKVPDALVGKLNANIRANTWLSSPLNHEVASILSQSGQLFIAANKQRQIANQRQLLARQVFDDLELVTKGYHVWLPLGKQWRSEQFTLEAKKQDLVVSSGGYFDCNGTDPHHVRLSLMSISSEQRLEQGLRALKTLLQSDANTLLSF